AVGVGVEDAGRAGGEPRVFAGRGARGVAGRARAVAEVPAEGRVVRGRGATAGVVDVRVQADVGLHAVEADRFARGDVIRGGDLRFEARADQARDARVREPQGGQVEDVVDVVVVEAQRLVVEVPREAAGEDRARASEERCEEEAALVGVLRFLFVLPAVQ